MHENWLEPWEKAWKAAHSNATFDPEVLALRCAPTRECWNRVSPHWDAPIRLLTLLGVCMESGSSELARQVLTTDAIDVLDFGGPKADISPLVLQAWMRLGIPDPVWAVELFATADRARKNLWGPALAARIYDLPDLTDAGGGPIVHAAIRVHRHDAQGAEGLTAAQVLHALAKRGMNAGSSQVARLVGTIRPWAEPDASLVVEACAHRGDPAWLELGMGFADRMGHEGARAAAAWLTLCGSAYITGSARHLARGLSVLTRFGETRCTRSLCAVVHQSKLPVRRVWMNKLRQAEGAHHADAWFALADHQPSDERRDLISRALEHDPVWGWVAAAAHEIEADAHWQRLSAAGKAQALRALAEVAPGRAIESDRYAEVVPVVLAHLGRDDSKKVERLFDRVATARKPSAQHLVAVVRHAAFAHVSQDRRHTARNLLDQVSGPALAVGLQAQFAHTASSAEFDDMYDYLAALRQSATRAPVWTDEQLGVWRDEMDPPTDESPPLHARQHREVPRAARALFAGSQVPRLSDLIDTSEPYDGSSDQALLGMAEYHATRGDLPAAVTFLHWMHHEGGYGLYLYAALARTVSQMPSPGRLLIRLAEALRNSPIEQQVKVVHHIVPTAMGTISHAEGNTLIDGLQGVWQSCEHVGHRVAIAGCIGAAWAHLGEDDSAMWWYDQSMDAAVPSTEDELWVPAFTASLAHASITLHNIIARALRFLCNASPEREQARIRAYTRALLEQNQSRQPLIDMIKLTDALPPLARRAAAITLMEHWAAHAEPEAFEQIRSMMPSDTAFARAKLQALGAALLMSGWADKAQDIESLIVHGALEPN